MADAATADTAAQMPEAPMPSATAPLTEDAFLADRQHFWGWFTGLIARCVIGVVVLLILLTIFLV